MCSCRCVYVCLCVLGALGVWPNGLLNLTNLRSFSDVFAGYFCVFYQKQGKSCQILKRIRADTEFFRGDSEYGSPVAI
jgi:hypothetical protein